jgi:hypothetical protein
VGSPRKTRCRGLSQPTAILPLRVRRSLDFLQIQRVYLIDHLGVGSCNRLEPVHGTLSAVSRSVEVQVIVGRLDHGNVWSQTTHFAVGRCTLGSAYVATPKFLNAFTAMSCNLGREGPPAYQCILYMCSREETDSAQPERRSGLWLCVHD